MAADLPDDYPCQPATQTEIRMGTIGNSVWSYWWCRNPTKIWLVYQAWIDTDRQNWIFTEGEAFASRPYKAFLNTYEWRAPLVVPPETISPYRPLYDAVVAAASTDAGRPVPGPSFAPIPNPPEIWVVTPNGGSFLRKTSKVVNGVVQAYGSGTQTVRIGTPCDHTKPSYPIGSTTKYLPMYPASNDVNPITDEVISCIRIQ